LPSKTRGAFLAGQHNSPARAGRTPRLAPGTGDRVRAFPASPAGLSTPGPGAPGFRHPGSGTPVSATRVHTVRVQALRFQPLPGSEASGAAGPAGTHSLFTDQSVAGSTPLGRGSDNVMKREDLDREEQGGRRRKDRVGVARGTWPELSGAPRRKQAKPVGESVQFWNENTFSACTRFAGQCTGRGLQLLIPGPSTDTYAAESQPGCSL